MILYFDKFGYLIKKDDQNEIWLRGDDKNYEVSAKFYNAAYNEINDKTGFVDLSGLAVGVVVKREDNAQSPVLATIITEENTKASVIVDNWWTEIMGEIKITFIIREFSKVKAQGIAYHTIGEANIPSDTTITESEKVDIELALASKENIANKTTTVRSSDVASDVLYPTEKAVAKRLASSSDSLEGHTNNFNNPHKVTKAQVGLGLVENRGIDNEIISGSSNYATSNAVYEFLQDTVLGGTVPSTRKVAGYTLQTDISAQNIATAVKSYLGLGTAASKNTGVNSGNVPIIGEDGKIDASIIPMSSGMFFGGTVVSKDDKPYVTPNKLLEEAFPDDVTSGVSFLLEESKDFSPAYFIATENMEIFGTSYVVGDWLLCNGANDYVKIENVDAVKSVNGKTGIVNIASNDIDITGYTKGTDSADITSGDTLNKALSKLENKTSKAGVNLIKLPLEYQNLTEENLIEVLGKLQTTNLNVLYYQNSDNTFVYPVYKFSIEDKYVVFADVNSSSMFCVEVEIYEGKIRCIKTEFATKEYVNGQTGLTPEQIAKSYQEGALRIFTWNDTLNNITNEYLDDSNYFVGTFTSNGQTFVKIFTDDRDTQDGDRSIFYQDSNGSSTLIWDLGAWKNENYKYITFASDTSNANLPNFMTTNGTRGKATHVYSTGYDDEEVNPRVVVRHTCSEEKIALKGYVGVVYTNLSDMGFEDIKSLDELEKFMFPGDSLVFGGLPSSTLYPNFRKTFTNHIPIISLDTVNVDTISIEIKFLDSSDDTHWSGSVTFYDSVTGYHAFVLTAFNNFVEVGGAEKLTRYINQAEKKIWKLNSSLNFTATFSQTINFISNNKTFKTFVVYQDALSNYVLQYVVDPEDATSDSYINVYNQAQGDFINTNYRLVTFETEPTGTLLTWLQNNAVELGDIYTYTITFDDLGNPIWNTYNKESNINETEIIATQKYVESLIVGEEASYVVINQPSSATNGALTSEQLRLLQSSDLVGIKFDNELYRKADVEHSSGYLTYTHNGYESSEHFQKAITITISTKAWVLNSIKIASKDYVDEKLSGVSVDLSGYYTKEEIDSTIGDINTILDNINGEEV